MANVNFEDALFSDDNLETPEENVIDDITQKPEEPQATEDGADDVDAGKEESKPEDEQTSIDADKEEQDDDTQKFYQTAYQNVLRELKEINPEIHNQVKERLKADRKKETIPQEKPKQEPADEDDLAVLRRIIKETVGDVMGEYNDRQARIVEERQVAEETIKAESALAKFIDETKFPKESLEDIYKEVRALNIDITSPGGPTAAAKAIIKEIQLQQLQGHIKQKVVEAQTDAINKTKALKDVAQPNAGASPTPRAKTDTEKLLESMQLAAGNPQANKEVFG